MRRAVYDGNRAMCPCGFPEAFGLAVNEGERWYLHTSRRWRWEGDRFAYGKKSFGIPGRDKRGPAELAMREADLREGFFYGKRHSDVEYYIPLPERFVCRNKRARAPHMTLVDQPFATRGEA